MENFLNEINQDIKDIFQYNIETSNAYVVPTRHDVNLTFPIGADKKGKLIETCVLMVDIRNSTKISRRLKKDKLRLGKIYSAFIYAMTRIADEYGYVRNIIGDRIMVVFEPKNCFIDALNCAAVMYTVGSRILSKHTGLDEFNIGIGIDYGEMLVLKTGIQKKYHEQSEYKGLVWVGDTANTASKLCDFANKSYSSPLFKIVYEHSEFRKIIKGSNVSYDPLIYMLLKKTDPEYEFKSITESKTTELNYEDFAKDIIVNNDGWKYKGEKVTSFNITNRTGITAPILMSGKIYSEFKNAEPKSIFLTKISSRDYPDKPFTGSGVYGGSLIIQEISKIKI